MKKIITGCLAMLGYLLIYNTMVIAQDALPLDPEALLGEYSQCYLFDDFQDFVRIIFGRSVDGVRSTTFQWVGELDGTIFYELRGSGSVARSPSEVLPWALGASLNHVAPKPFFRNNHLCTFHAFLTEGPFPFGPTKFTCVGSGGKPFTPKLCDGRLTCFIRAVPCEEADNRDRIGPKPLIGKAVSK